MKVFIGSLTEKQMSEPSKVIKVISDAPPIFDVHERPIMWFAITLSEYGIWLSFQDDADKVQDFTEDIWSKSIEEIRLSAKERMGHGTWRIR